MVLAREPVIQPRGTVDAIVSIFIRIRSSTLARKIYGFVFIHFRERFQTYMDSLDPNRVLVVDGRSKRIKKYTDSNESALVWTGPYLVSLDGFLLYMTSMVGMSLPI